MRISDWSSDVCSSDLPAILRLPAVECLLADPVPAADLRRRRPGLLLTQHPDDLFLGEPALLHRPSPRDRWGDWGPTVIEGVAAPIGMRSEAHTSELQSLMRSSYAVFCLTQKQQHHHT